MSSLLYMGAGMSFEEKRAWIYAVIATVVPVIYFTIVLRQVPGEDVTGIAYVWPLLTAVGVAIVANIAATILAGVVSPREAGLADERDRQINRLGEYVAFYVM